MKSFFTVTIDHKTNLHRDKRLQNSFVPGLESEIVENHWTRRSFKKVEPYEQSIYLSKKVHKGGEREREVNDRWSIIRKDWSILFSRRNVITMSHSYKLAHRLLLSTHLLIYFVFLIKTNNYVIIIHEELKRTIS